MEDGFTILFTCISFSLIVVHASASALPEHAGERFRFAPSSDLQSFFQAWAETHIGPSKNSKMGPHATDYHSRTKWAKVWSTAVGWEAYNRTEWDLNQPRFSTLFSKLVQHGKWSGLNNLCMHGKLVPELFVVGVVKGATTSLSNDLRQSPAILWPYKPFMEFKTYDNDFVKGNTVKEGHFLDEYYFLGKKYMLESFPWCRVDQRVTAVEAAPRYFMDPTIPQRIALWYGETFKPRLKFVVLLRNAVDRFFSDYWHAKSDFWCSEYNNRTFNDVLDDIVTGGAMKYKGGIPGCQDRLEASLYKTSLTRWFTTFTPQQFMIVPWLYQIQPGIRGRKIEPVAESIWDMFSLQRGPVHFNTHFNIHSHPTLQQGSDPHKLKAFTEFIANESSVETLAQLFASNPGVYLHEYKGQPKNEHAIAKWLKFNW